MRGTQAGISVPEESAGPAEEEVCLGEMADSDQAPAHSDDQASSGSPDHSLLPGGSSQSGSHLCVSSLGLDAWRKKIHKKIKWTILRNEISSHHHNAMPRCDYSTLYAFLISIAYMTIYS